MQHVDDGTLHAWLDEALTGTEAAAVATHLDACGACRARLDEERALCDRAGALLALDEPALDRPSFDALVARAHGGAGSADVADSGGPDRGADHGSERSSHRWLTTVGWAASVAFALAIGWMARDVMRPADAPDVMASAAEVDAPDIEPALEPETSATADRKAEAEPAGVASAPRERRAQFESADVAETPGARDRSEEAAGASPALARVAPELLQLVPAPPATLPEPVPIAPPAAAAPPPSRVALAAPPPPPAPVVEPALRGGVESAGPASVPEPAAPAAGSGAGRGGRGGGGGGGGRAAVPEPLPAASAAAESPSAQQPSRQVAATGQALRVDGQVIGGSIGDVARGAALGPGWQVVGRTEAAARTGMPLYGIDGLEPAQTAIGPDGRQVRTRYLLESGSILDLVQEREPPATGVLLDQAAGQNSSQAPLAGAAPSARVLIARRDDVRVTLQADAPDVNLEALAGRLRID